MQQLVAVECLQWLLHVVVPAQQPAAAEQQLAAVECLQRLLHVVARAQQLAAAKQQLAAVDCLQRLLQVVTTVQLVSVAVASSYNGVHHDVLAEHRILDEITP